MILNLKHHQADALPYREDAKYIYIARNPFDNSVANYSIVKGYILFDAEGMSWGRYFDWYMQGKGKHHVVII